MDWIIRSGGGSLDGKGDVKGTWYVVWMAAGRGSRLDGSWYVSCGSDVTLRLQVHFTPRPQSDCCFILMELHGKMELHDSLERCGTMVGASGSKTKTHT